MDGMIQRAYTSSHYLKFVLTEKSGEPDREPAGMRAAIMYSAIKKRLTVLSWL